MNKLPLIMPDRMIVLSILPSPTPGQLPAPFGFGALVVEQTGRGEAHFQVHAHAFGAKYRSDALCERLQPLFTPETMALVLNPVCGSQLIASPHRGPDIDRLFEHVPRSGLRTRICASVPHHVLANAAGMAGVQLPCQAPSPLARIRRIDAEAQAAWVYCLFSQPSSRARGRLFASFEAWRRLQQARLLKHCLVLDAEGGR